MHRVYVEQCKERNTLTGRVKYRVCGVYKLPNTALDASNRINPVIFHAGNKDIKDFLAVTSTRAYKVGVYVNQTKIVKNYLAATH